MRRHIKYESKLCHFAITEMLVITTPTNNKTIFVVTSWVWVLPLNCILLKYFEYHTSQRKFFSTLIFLKNWVYFFFNMSRMKKWFSLYEKVCERWKILVHFYVNQFFSQFKTIEIINVEFELFPNFPSKMQAMACQNGYKEFDFA